MRYFYLDSCFYGLLWKCLKIIFKKEIDTMKEQKVINERTDCFAYRQSKACGILKIDDSDTAIDCSKCKFYKTTKQFVDDQLKWSMYLEREHPCIFKRYYG